MPKQTNTIHPKALKVARKRRNMTQEKLAEALRCSKDTVSRWERGSTKQVRSRLRSALCAVLRVEWVKLSEPPDEETRDPWTRKKQISVDMDLRNSLQLVAERYGVRLQAVLELAPLLFIIIAERSLMWRQKKLKEIADVWNEAEETLLNKCGHLGGIIAARSVSATNRIQEEEKSLNQRDVFGRSINYQHWTEGSEGPFLHFVRKFMEGLPEGAVSDIESINGDTIFGYTVASDTLEKCTGLSRNNEMDRHLIGHIRCGFIDFGECMRVRRDRDESGYRQWLSDELERIKQELGEDIFAEPDGDPYA